MAIDNIAAAITPLLTTVGFGGLVGFLIGFVIKKLFKILAIIAGVLFAVVMCLEQQGIINVNWDKINRAYHDVLSTERRIVMEVAMRSAVVKDIIVL